MSLGMKVGSTGSRRGWLAIPIVGLLAAYTPVGEVAAWAVPIERVSVSSGGAQGNAQTGSWGPDAISYDGRFVAFSSMASNLVRGDTNNNADVFVRDRLKGRTERVSLSATGGQFDSGGRTPSISADGRFVTFTTDACHVEGDTMTCWEDIMMRDRWTRTTVKVAVSSAEVPGDAGSYGGALSANGRYVVFNSNATNLVPGDTNSAPDLFVRDLVAGTTVRVSVSSTGAQADAGSGNAAKLSADGRYVVFSSIASNLVPGDSNGVEDVFRRDLRTGCTTRVSVAKGGGAANGPSWYPVVSADGTRVAFLSFATNLAGEVDGTMSQVFLRDLVRGKTALVSVGHDGVAGNGLSGTGGISADGTRVVFVSHATNLAGSDTNGLPDVFVRDVSQWTTTRVTIGHGGAEANGSSDFPGISGNGRWVVFNSEATNLVPGDTNGFVDTFVAPAH